MPTIDIPDKICSHCGGTRWVFNIKKNWYSCVKKNKERDALYNSIPEIKERNKKQKQLYYINNKERFSELGKKRYEVNKELINKRASDYQKTERGKKNTSLNYQKNRKNLTDVYIKDTIVRTMALSKVKLSCYEITKEQIERYRIYLKLRHEISSLKK